VAAKKILKGVLCHSLKVGEGKRIKGDAEIQRIEAARLRLPREEN